MRNYFQFGTTVFLNIAYNFQDPLPRNPEKTTTPVPKIWNCKKERFISKFLFSIQTYCTTQVLHTKQSTRFFLVDLLELLNSFEMIWLSIFIPFYTPRTEYLRSFRLLRGWLYRDSGVGIHWRGVSKFTARSRGGVRTGWGFRLESSLASRMVEFSNIGAYKQALTSSTQSLLARELSFALQDATN